MIVLSTGNETVRPLPWTYPSSGLVNEIVGVCTEIRSDAFTSTIGAVPKIAPVSTCVTALLIVVQPSSGVGQNWVISASTNTTSATTTEPTTVNAKMVSNAMYSVSASTPANAALNSGLHA
ncbi:unannotated protein [freshwater metagenome]|uniref:Unannotated protein n=1 Tax=freshwater metagenome TaxID=449393 RepID=A0A6J7QSA6_9ZZZZ